MRIARCMSVGRGDSDEALAQPFTEKIGVDRLNNPCIKKSSIGGINYMDYLWEPCCLPVYI
jgi:hypothetical protein